LFFEMLAFSPSSTSAYSQPLGSTSADIQHGRVGLPIGAMCSLMFPNSAVPSVPRPRPKAEVGARARARAAHRMGTGTGTNSLDKQQRIMIELEHLLEKAMLPAAPSKVGNVGDHMAIGVCP